MAANQVEAWAGLHPDDMVKSCKYIEMGSCFSLDGIYACIQGTVNSPLLVTTEELNSGTLTHVRVVQRRRALFAALPRNRLILTTSLDTGIASSYGRLRRWSDCPPWTTPWISAIPYGSTTTRRSPPPWRTCGTARSWAGPVRFNGWSPHGSGTCSSTASVGSGAPSGGARGAGGWCRPGATGNDASWVSIGRRSDASWGSE